MRLPFLQLESDLVSHGAPTVATLAGCSIPQALGHISILRAWAVSRSTDDSPPDGWVYGEGAARIIEGSAQWQGAKGALVSALADANLIQVDPCGIRVLHLEPYAKAWERNAKAKERMANNRERSANKRVPEANASSTTGERPAKFMGQTQTQMEDVEEKQDLAAPADAAPPVAQQASLLPPGAPKAAKQRKPSEPKSEPKGDPRHHPLMRAMEAAYSEALPGEKWDLTESSAGREAKALKGLLAKADADPRTAGDGAQAEILRRWRHALADQYSRVRYAHLLLDRWGQYATPRSAGAAKPADSRAPVRAETQPQYDPSKPAVTVLKGAEAFKEWCP